MSDELLDDGVVAVEKSPVEITDTKATYSFANTNPTELGETVKSFLLKQGYRLEQGSETSGVYGKGSKALRVLFGAFVKRFTWGVRVADSDGKTTLVFSKDEKGYWGGVVGVAQVKNEYKKITSLLKQFHLKHHGDA